MVALIVFLIVAVPIAVIIAFLLLDESIVNIKPGEMGLLLLHGKATDKWIGPGRHWVPALRRRTVQAYPARELSFRASVDASGDDDEADLERQGPATHVVLGDRATGVAEYTIRFRLDPDRLQTIHDRFGPDGIWSAVRDLGARSVRASLIDASVSVDDVYGPARLALRDRIGEHVTADLAADGFAVSVFELGTIDLGGTGESVQAAVRARLELEREQAQAAMRRERAERDAEVARLLADVDAGPALRYRETDAWRELAFEVAKGQRPLPATSHSTTSSTSTTPLVQAIEEAVESDDDGEEA